MDSGRVVGGEEDSARVRGKEVFRTLLDFPFHCPSRAGLGPREVKCEEFMTSAEWLNVHGVRRKGLRYSDLVASLAFRHCDGVLRNPTHQAPSGVDVVPAYEIVQAKYCSKFVHLRWKDGSVVHINLTKRMADSFLERLEQVTVQCRERMSWLRRGSRELFGTILEESVALVIDTSSSMALHLPLVKHKFTQLVQEQLCHKREFTVLQYSTGVNPWRPRLVPVSTHTLGHAKQWVESLQAGGTSNLLDVLRLATTLPHVQGVYVLTDGRPDQVRQISHFALPGLQLTCLPCPPVSLDCSCCPPVLARHPHPHHLLQLCRHASQPLSGPAGCRLRRTLPLLCGWPRRHAGASAIQGKMKLHCCLCSGPHCVLPSTSPSFSPSLLCVRRVWTCSNSWTRSPLLATSWSKCSSWQLSVRSSGTLPREGARGKTLEAAPHVDKQQMMTPHLKCQWKERPCLLGKGSTAEVRLCRVLLCSVHVSCVV